MVSKLSTDIKKLYYNFFLLFMTPTVLIRIISSQFWLNQSQIQIFSWRYFQFVFLVKRFFKTLNLFNTNSVSFYFNYAKQMIHMYLLI
jgi:hypothetical protein